MSPGELPIANIVQLWIGQFAGARQGCVEVLDCGIWLAHHQIATAATDVDDLDVRLRDAQALRAQVEERLVQFADAVKVG